VEKIDPLVLRELARDLTRLDRKQKERVR